MNMRLKMALVGAGDRQFVLAARIGMSETRLSRIVRGRVEPTTDERKRIADALGLTEEELFPSGGAVAPSAVARR
jgi:transcriptional regulator with XRE-family HTH domain